MVNVTGMYASTYDAKMKQHIQLERDATTDEISFFVENVGCPAEWKEGSRGLTMLKEDWISWSYVEAPDDDNTTLLNGAVTLNLMIGIQRGRRLGSGSPSEKCRWSGHDDCCGPTPFTRSA